MRNWKVRLFLKNFWNQKSSRFEKLLELKEAALFARCSLLVTFCLFPVIFCSLFAILARETFCVQINLAYCLFRAVWWTHLFPYNYFLFREKKGLSSNYDIKSFSSLFFSYWVTLFSLLYATTRLLDYANKKQTVSKILKFIKENW